MIDERIANWLATGDMGSSSKAIMLWLSAKKVAGGPWGPSTPSDCGDLLRCLRLLEAVPEWKSRMAEMADAGGEWPTFAKRWPEIEKSFFSEVGGKLPSPGDRSWKAPETYNLMKRVEQEAREAAGTKSQYVQLGQGAVIRFRP